MFSHVTIIYQLLSLAPKLLRLLASHGASEELRHG